MNLVKKEKKNQVTLHKVSLHLALAGCWVEYHWFSFFHTICPYLECRSCSSPFFQYLLTIVPSHPSPWLPVHLKMHFQQPKRTQMTARFAWKRMGDFLWVQIWSIKCFVLGCSVQLIVGVSVHISCLNLKASTVRQCPTTHMLGSSLTRAALSTVCFYHFFNHIYSCNTWLVKWQVIQWWYWTGGSMSAVM